jgi:PEGA domain-containing protein
MTETPSEPPRERHPSQQPGIPSWVPTSIGIVLVVMAALAVYTGLRYRNPTLANGIIKTRKPPRAMTGGGPPGEPEPGASLVFPENSPTASTTTVAGAMSARRGLLTNVMPDDAMVYVNGVLIGQAKQFNAPDEVYDFPAPGAYTIRLMAPGYKEAQYVVSASDNATKEIARIDVKLQRQ